MGTRLTWKSKKVVRPPTQNSDSRSPAQARANRKAVRMTSLASNRHQLMCAEGINSFGLPSAKLGNLGMTGPGGEWWRGWMGREKHVAGEG
jgi:hypothetical protein